MRSHFQHLSFTNRLQLEAWLKAKVPVTKIAGYLGVHVSTIYREIKRGEYKRVITYRDAYGYEKKFRFKKAYSPDIAEMRYRENLKTKGAPLKIGNDYEFADYVEKKIVDEGYSPDSVLGEIRKNNLQFKTRICTTTLYSYIEKGVFGRLSLEDLKEKGKTKKRSKREVKRAPRGTSIEQRSLDILNRDEFGHWEMDCVCGPTKQVLLVLTERMTRKEIIMKMSDQKAESVVHCLNLLERRFGKSFRHVFKTITVDNGPEFSAFVAMERSIFGHGKGRRTLIYYCHPYSAYERGSNERMNREIRRKIPKGFDLSKVSDKDVSDLEMALNNLPRRVLKYSTPQELFEMQMSHLTKS